MAWPILRQEEGTLAKYQQEAPARAALAAGAVVPPAMAAAVAAANRLANLFAALQARSKLGIVSAAARPFGLRDSVLPSRLLQVTNPVHSHSHRQTLLHGRQASWQKADRTAVARACAG